ncbi:Uncharacterised protein [uncultured archaeon]|nr:Uncharacterised protein [uncultured archaeon]
MTKGSGSGQHGTLTASSMKNRELFFVTGIIAIVIGLYLLIFVQSIGIDFGGHNIIKISTIFDGVFLTIMGIAIVIASSRDWDS